MSEPKYLRNDCPTCGAPMLGVHYHEAAEVEDFDNVDGFEPGYDEDHEGR